MNELKQALQTAFEALRLAEALLDPINHNAHCECDPSVGYQCVLCGKPDPELVQIRAALAAAEAALAQPEPDPVAELASVTAERDQLNILLSIACNDQALRAVVAERDQLRAEAERLQSALDDARAGESVAQMAADPLIWECKAGGLRRLTQNQYNRQPDRIKRHYSLIAPTAQPLTRDQVNDLLTEAEYDQSSSQERADFINGLRHCERAHGINAEATTPSAPSAPADPR